MPEKEFYESVESSRDIRTFRCVQYVMMIIPSLQEDFFHVIIEEEGNGVSVNCLLTKEGIYNAYAIEL